MWQVGRRYGKDSLPTDGAHRIFVFFGEALESGFFLGVSPKQVSI